MSTTDERRGLPSASKISRYAACPGSFKLEQGCEEFRTEEEILWAESGDRIHAYLAGELPAENLDEKELDIAQRCKSQEDALLEKCNISAPDTHTEREQRLWLSQGRKKLMSGKPDAVFVVRLGTGLVNDYKTGYGDQDGVETNYQIRSNIVLASDKFPEVAIWCGAIIQPLVKSEPEYVRYTKEDVALAKQEILGILESIRQPNAKRVAGPQCRWCPAVTKCPEAKAMLQVFGLIDTNAEGEVLAGYLVLAKAAKPVIERIEKHAKQMLKDGRDVPGWMLGTPQKNRVITDPFAAFKLLEEAGMIDRDTFLKQCVSVGIGDTEDAVKQFKGITGKAATAAVNETLASLIEFKPKEAPLVPIK